MDVRDASTNREMIGDKTMTRENWQLRQDILRYLYNNGNNYLFKNSETKIFLSYCEMSKDDWMGCIRSEEDFAGTVQ